MLSNVGSEDRTRERTCGSTGARPARAGLAQAASVPRRESGPGPGVAEVATRCAAHW